jgi:hypothetical protein
MSGADDLKRWVGLVLQPWYILVRMRIALNVTTRDFLGIMRILKWMITEQEVILYINCKVAEIMTVHSKDVY